MKILIINPPHEAIGSRMPGEMLPPLGLLAIGGPLLDDGHDVTLLDGDVDDLALTDIVRRAVAHAPDAILIGHNGSTSAHPTVAELFRRLRPLLPDAWFIYGGIFPTYHWRECLEQCPEVDIIVRGEGEETARKLMRALSPPPPCGEGLGVGVHRDSESRDSPLPASPTRGEEKWSPPHEGEGSSHPSPASPSASTASHTRPRPRR